VVVGGGGGGVPQAMPGILSAMRMRNLLPSADGSPPGSGPTRPVLALGQLAEGLPCITGLPSDAFYVGEPVAVLRFVTERGDEPEGGREARAQIRARTRSGGGEGEGG
jgi:hypothetical protein